MSSDFYRLLIHYSWFKDFNALISILQCFPCLNHLDIYAVGFKSSLPVLNRIDLSLFKHGSKISIRELTQGTTEYPTDLAATLLCVMDETSPQVVNCTLDDIGDIEFFCDLCIGAGPRVQEPHIMLPELYACAFS